MIHEFGVRKGRITLNRMVELLATNPAKLFGLYPRKGTIAVGSDADIVVFDPEKRVTISAATHHSKVDYNLFEGTEVTGSPGGRAAARERARRERRARRVARDRPVREAREVRRGAPSGPHRRRAIGGSAGRRRGIRPSRSFSRPPSAPAGSLLFASSGVST